MFAVQFILAGEFTRLDEHLTVIDLCGSILPFNLNVEALELAATGRRGLPSSGNALFGKLIKTAIKSGRQGATADDVAEGSQWRKIVG